MRSTGLLALAAAAAVAPASAYTGFNYGSTRTDGSAKSESDFAREFSLAKGLDGTNGQFTSARLYTNIQAGTANTPISAFAAAVQEDVSLLIGIWGSAGKAAVDNEVAALKAGLAADPKLAKQIIGISIGSEDLYRISPLGIQAKAGIGEEPATIAGYIKSVKSALAGTGLSKVPVGHVDTWTAWVNGSNQDVIDASDFIGFDAYPYFQSTMSNPIGSAKDLFDEALGKTKAATGGKPVWITETGWPVSGKDSNLAIPSIKNARTYWDEVGCPLFGEENVWWYTVQDADPDTPNPSFGIVGAGGSKPLYDLSCKDISTSTDSASSSSATKASDSGSSSDSDSDSDTSTSSDTDGEGSPALGHAGSTGTITGVPGPTGTGSAGGSGGNSTFTVGTATPTAPGSPTGPSASSVQSGAAVAMAGNAGPVIGSAAGLIVAFLAAL